MAKSPPKPHRPLIEELERRLLLSADPASSLLDPSALQADPSQTGFTQLVDDPDSAEGANASSQAAEIGLRHELVVVDTGVEGYQQLVDQLTRSTYPGVEIDVVLLDADGDGVGQIRDVLADHHDLDAVHIVSHGTDGGVRLGNAWLSSDSLSGYEDDLSSWADALAEDADLLFYGCNLAAGSDGTALIESVAKLTGADVAASDDLTGHDSLGGDWELEYRLGEIEASTAIPAEASESWEHVLAVAPAEAWQNLAADTTAATTISATHEVTTAAGSDRLLLVALNTRISTDDTVTVTSATFGGVALHEITNSGENVGRNSTWMGYLLESEIPAGAQDLSITVETTSPTILGKKLLAATYTGVDQTLPINDSSSNTVNADAPIPFAEQIDFEAGGEVVYVASFNGTGLQGTTEPTGFSKIYTTEVSGDLTTTIGHKDDVSSTGSEAPSTAIDFDGTNTYQSLAVVALNPTGTANAAPIAFSDSSSTDEEAVLNVAAAGVLAMTPMMEAWSARRRPATPSDTTPRMVAAAPGPMIPP
jgi:hypothetical protein